MAPKSLTFLLAFIGFSFATANSISDTAVSTDTEQAQEVDSSRKRDTDTGQEQGAESAGGSSRKRDLSACRELRPCEPCNKLETEIDEECAKTGYRRVVRCVDDDGHQDKFVSCPNGLTSFWVFEGIMLFGLMVCGNLTMFRRRHLDRLVKDRIMEQIQNTA